MSDVTDGSFSALSERALKVRDQFESMAQRLDELHDQHAALLARRVSKEAAQAWSEGHALLCRVSDRGHQNPHAG